MPNTFQYADWITLESLRLLKNKLQVATLFNTKQNAEYDREFPIGETLRVKLPWRPQIRNGLGYNPQAIDRIYTTVTLDQIFGVDFEWDSAEKALEMERGEEQIKEEYLNPAMSQIAQEIDSRAALYAYQNTNNTVGVLGTDPTNFETFGQARQTMLELAGLDGAKKKGVCLAPAINTSMVQQAQTLFNPPDAISKQYKEGAIGRYAGFDWYESMSLYSHTASTWQSTVELSAAPANGATTLSLTVTSGDTFNKGDVISLQAVRPVNPATRRTFAGATTLKKFVITSASQTISGTAATITVSPAIYYEGPYQNVNVQPASGADLTLFPGTASPNGKSGVQSLALTSDAFALVGVKLEVPKAVELASQSRDPETGLAVRFVRMFDPQQSKMVNRFDVLMGFGNLYPDNCAVRILGA